VRHASPEVRAAVAFALGSLVHVPSPDSPGGASGGEDGGGGGAAEG
jgi:hypothetical protein